MRVTVVTPACHFPSYGAVQQDIYSMVSFLSELGHSVSLVSLDQKGQDNTVLESALKKNSVPYKTFLPGSSSVRVALKNKNLALLDGSAQAFHNLVNSHVWTAAVLEFQPEVIISIGTYSWPIALWGRENNVRTVIRSHNFEPKHFWEELTAKQKWSPLNWIRFLVKYKSEQLAVRYAHLLAAISPREVKEYKSLDKKGTISLLPLVSLLHIPGKIRAENKKVIDLFFLGATYNVPFHERGAKELITAIAPKVEQKARGKFRFHICGSKLPKYLIDACDGEKIIYEGYIKNLEEFFESMDAGVFPVWSGRGMKQKIFESVIRGFPVVVPAKTIGEYPLIHNESALIAQAPEEVVEKVLALQDVSVRAAISKGALQFAESMFSKKNFTTTFNEMLYGKK